MNILAWDFNDANLNSNYHLFARHTKGDTAYAIDSDIENQLYYTTDADQFVNNIGIIAPTNGPAWPGRHL